jgi:hypothetical protein
MGDGRSVLLAGDDRLEQHRDGEVDVVRTHARAQVHASRRLRHPNDRLDVTHGNVHTARGRLAAQLGVDALDLLLVDRVQRRAHLWREGEGEMESGESWRGARERCEGRGVKPLGVDRCAAGMLTVWRAYMMYLRSSVWSMGPATAEGSSDGSSASTYSGCERMWFSTTNSARRTSPSGSTRSRTCHRREVG